MNAGESRAAAMLLEEDYGLPTGLLQSIIENKTGWRTEQRLLPKHREPETPDNRLAEHKSAAQRLKDKLGEFDGIVPLAIDAYYRGDKATRRSLSTGFDTVDANDIYKTLARMPKFGGETLTDKNIQDLQESIGHPPPSNIGKVAQASAPTPTRPVQLNSDNQGRYYTGDTFLDAMIYIESRGNPNAVSPIGATGLFQFTRGTGKAYGLITKDGRDLRRDPQASLVAAQRLAADNAKALRRAGIPITPTNLYLAHQQGAGGAIQIIKAAATGRGVSANIQKNMNHNNGRGKTPAQFYAFIDQKVQDAITKTGGRKINVNGQERLAYGNTGTVADLIPTKATAVLMTTPRPKKDIGKEISQVVGGSFSDKINLNGILDDVFRLDDEPNRDFPKDIRRAITGMITSMFETQNL